MRYTKTLFSLGFLILLTCLLASCGSTSSSTTSSYATSSATSTPDTSTTAPTTTIGKYGVTPTTSTSNTNASTLKTTNATINGKAETILTNTQGMTLYYFTPDTQTTAACTGGCAGTWPPLLATGSLTSTAPGKLTSAANANGTQAQYNGHFLYTYAGDSAPGQTNGQGIAGKWFVVTTNLK